MCNGYLDRPALAPTLSSREFERWYWLKDELEEFARQLGVRATGSKTDIADRISATLDGRPLPPQAAPRRALSQQLSGAISEATVIPAGQRSSQLLRKWFMEQIGPQFRFDAIMRAFIAEADGTTTMGDAVRVWHSTRDRPSEEIGAQFELNRFTRQWHAQNPGGSRRDLLQEWARYRNTPVDERGRA